MSEILKRTAEALSIPFTDDMERKLLIYRDLLLEVNEHMNLTAITDPEEILKKHFADSLTGSPCLPMGAQVIDVGTGAGFPGMVLSIVRPDLSFTLLDALRKRVDFLRRVTDELGLSARVSCVHARAEEAAQEPRFREQFGAAVSRALAPLSVVMEYSAGFVKKGGRIVAYKGPAVKEELPLAANAAAILGLSEGKLIDAGLPDTEHVLAVFQKERALSLQYPRRQSKIKKTPL